MTALSGNPIADFIFGVLSLAWSGWMLKVLVAHVLVNVVVAYAVTIATGTFKMSKMWEFLYRKLLPLVTIYVTINVMSEYVTVLPWATGLTAATWAAMEAMLTSDLADNLEQLGLKLKVIQTPVLPNFIRK
ncbi:MAG: phage holin family protein [Methanophagales archaeon]|nr:phage holin family protein [Methanophagales archaeon]